jgi:hypothetical protein
VRPGRAQRTSKPDSPSGGSGSTSSPETEALPGPARQKSTSADTASRGPSNTASTDPSPQLRTQPLTPRRSASRRVLSRKNTPCTRPVARTRLRTGDSAIGGYGSPMASTRATGTLAAELEAAGGVSAPASATARLRDVLATALRHGREELAKRRSGYGLPVEVGVAAQDGLLLAATPAAASLRADPEAAGEREWLLVVAAVAALVDLACPGPPASAGDLALRAGDTAGFLVLALPAPGVEAAELEELAPMAFEEHAGTIDRLRAHALALPPGVLDASNLREPIGAGHPLRVAEVEARLDPALDGEQREEAVLALLRAGDEAAVRPHEDPDPGRRVARRILQRLDGMGKWGGYHTDFAHLARGFAGNDRALAQDVGEALIAAGLLAEKPSVGQRHVFLNPRRAGDIRAFIERGAAPPGVRLPPR